ncbi:MAG: hypothetical protein HQM11_17880 [SAR324 cluster bacterium]|nr:hypothetical protein [SAR324 cluster bacterium]
MMKLSNFLLVIMLWTMSAPCALSAPTPLEMENIQGQVRQAFKEFIQLWRTERYFELYDYGTEQSRKKLTLEEYATRMVELNWVPVGDLKDEEMELSFVFRTMLYVNVPLEFKHKSNQSLQFKKKQAFLLMLENNKWRFDLLQMIRSPFYTPEKPLREDPSKPQ